MATLSLCMIVKDEEGFLQDCLDSVKDIVDEVVIVDTGSKDRTKEIANRFGAKMFDFKWLDDFSAARNFSLEKATSNWILVLDADEMIDEDGKKEISKIVNAKEHCMKDIIGFKLDQRTYLPKKGGSLLKTTDKDKLAGSCEGYESSRLVRLFRNSPKIRFRNKVHELVEHSLKEQDGEIIQTDIVLHHFSHLKKNRIHSKAKDYVDLMWEQLQGEPDNPRYNRQVALAFLEKGRKDLALKYFKRALKSDPDYPGIFADMGKLYVELNKPRDAIKLFNMALFKDKNDVSSMNNLAVLYMNMGSYGVAQKLFEKALEKEPENKCVLSNREKLKEKMNKKD